MLRRILLASAGAMALTGAAIAADLPGRGPPPVYLPPPPVFTWTGLYIGGQIGYKWGTDNGTIADDDLLNGVGSGAADAGLPDEGFSSVPINSNPSGAIGGAHIGYNWQIAQFVLGAEADVDATNFQGHALLVNNTFFELDDGKDGRVSIRSTIEGSFRGRLGWAFNNWLIYGTGGVAFTDFTTNYNKFQNFDSRTKSRVGWTAGGGIEYALTPNWLIGVEYRYSDFGRFTDSAIFGENGMFDSEHRLNVSHHVTQNRVQARVSYKFDWFNPVVAKY